MEIQIEQLKTFSSDLTPIINGLLAQLSPDARTLTDSETKTIIEDSSNRIIVARVDTKVVGMLTLVIANVLFAKKALLEEIVVDKNFQSKGIGKKLINEAITQARKEGAVHIDFTSNPARVNANKFYEHMGFQKRDTNVYRIKL
jgi:ribosomal protein S18 acetylase RimI-like enzyme